MQFGMWLLENTLGDHLDKLKYKQDGLTIYKAGLPRFDHNFTRDGIISSILFNDPEMLKDQLTFCAIHQGKAKSRYTGEEPGKIFHEIEGKEIRGKGTKYNACDSTALFLLGHEVYQNITGNKELAKDQKSNIKRASDYILSHIKDGLFIEDPRFCGAKKFALKVTYWKDSAVHNRDGGEPDYPVTYSLAHVQNMRGLKSASVLFNSVRIDRVVENMEKSISKLYDEEQGAFHIAIDRKGPIAGIASDSLHALFYLDRTNFSVLKARKIAKTSKILETSIGYRSLDPENSDKALRDYHSKTVWPFVQAMIHIGAKKFGLTRPVEISSRIVKFLSSNHEMVTVHKNNSMIEGGCDPCLWTIAAKYYFENYRKVKYDAV